MTFDELRTHQIEGIDRLLSNPMIRRHMSDEDVRIAECTRQLWQTNDDAINALLKIVNGG